MNVKELSKVELVKRLERFKKEYARLRTIEIAFNAQNELTSSLIGVEQAATGKLMLKAMLIKTVQVCNQLTSAEESSLFLLDGEGAIADSILARGATIQKQKQNLIGKVLDKGLAGWVCQHREIGLIIDTKTDDRWLKFPCEPYVVRSALCVPILFGKVLLGLLTLMHSEPGHFNAQSVFFMQTIAAHMALVLDNAKLYCDNDRQATQVVEELVLEDLNSPEEESSAIGSNNLSDIGMYILTFGGKFLYADRKLADIFDYPFAELVSLESAFHVIATEDYVRVIEEFESCFGKQGKTIYLTCKAHKRDGVPIDIEIEGKGSKFYGKSAIIGMIRQK
ncbi:MAG: GAF domain-containing protein [Cyanobacteriota bacterium]|nr:GAF domain-containing protein [Cyanobacteriota bacterium]